MWWFIVTPMLLMHGCYSMNNTGPEQSTNEDYPPKPGPMYGQTCAEAYGRGYCCKAGHFDATGQCLGYPDELTCVWEPQYTTCPFDMQQLQVSCPTRCYDAMQEICSGAFRGPLCKMCLFRQREILLHRGCPSDPNNQAACSLSYCRQF